LALAASNAAVAERRFFSGALRKAEIGAALLLATSEVALRRYYVPPAMLARILREADPVITAADGRLRFESLSQCCGVYARADLPPDMLKTDLCGPIAGRARRAKLIRPWRRSGSSRLFNLPVQPQRAYDLRQEKSGRW
jgi:hypothetical protein